MAVMGYMVGILIIFCYPFIFSKLSHLAPTIDYNNSLPYLQDQSPNIVISPLIQKFLFSNIPMRTSIKPSEFKKEHRAKISFPETRQEAPLDTENISKYLDKAEDNKASRWLNHLHERPLLELLNEQVEKNQFTPIKPTELNCYQRLKTLLSVQNGGKCSEERAESNSKLLKNVVIFETEINKLEQNYRQIQKGKKSGLQSKNSRSYLCSKSFSKNTSILEKSCFNSTLNATLKQFSRGTHPRNSTKHDRPKNEQIAKAIKQEIAELKKQSFSKFIQHKKSLNEKVYAEIEQVMNSELEKKIEDIVDRKISQYEQIKEENSRFNNILLEKELHIEHLLKELKLKEEKLAHEIEKQEPHQQLITLRQTVQQFYDEYHSIFGNLSLGDLKKKLDYMENMCLNKYTSSEGQHLEIYSRLKYEKMELEEKLREKEQKYQIREKQFNAIIHRREKYEQLDNSDEKHEIFNRIPEYKLKMDELQKLQKYILNRYVEWLNSKTESEAKVIKTINNPSALHNYEEMIEDMLYFHQEYGSSEKQISYISKLIAAILKITKLIAPNKLHQKLQPLKCLDQIEIFLKSLKNRRMPNKKRTLKTKTQIVIENLDQEIFLS